MRQIGPVLVELALPILLGKLIVDIATGQIEEPEEAPAEKRARSAGRKGGKTRAKKLTPATGG